LFLYCEQEPDSPIIARVGSAILTIDDLYNSIPPEYSEQITREQMVNYVKQWIDTELLYQEAIRQKIHKEKEIRERITQMEKNLLSAEIISRRNLNKTNYNVNEDAIESYYQKHKKLFIRTNNAIRFIEIVVNDAKTAWLVRKQINQSNFLDLAVKYSSSPVNDPRNIPFFNVEDLAPEISSIISQLRPGGTTNSIEVNDNYHIIRVLEKRAAGEQATLDEVRDVIVNNLTTEEHKKDMKLFLNELTMKTDYEFHIDIIPGMQSSPDGTGIEMQSIEDSDSITTPETPINEDPDE